MHWTDTVEHNYPILTTVLKDRTSVGILLKGETAGSTGLYIRVNGSNWYPVTSPRTLKDLKTYLQCCDCKEDIENLIESRICDDLHYL